MILQNSIKFIRYFGQGKKSKLVCFAFLSFIAGLLEFLGIALIYPFILMLIRPEMVTGMKFYSTFASLTNISETSINALILGLLALCLFIIKNLYMILFLRLQSFFISGWIQDIANIFMKFFLFAPFSQTLKSSTSTKLYIINNLCSGVVNFFVIRSLVLLTNTIIVVMIIGLIMIKFPAAASVSIIFTVLSMLVQNKYLKKATAAITEKINQENIKITALTCSNIDNIKEIKIICSEETFYNKYTTQGEIIRNLRADSDYYAGMPPYIVEILIVISLLILGAFIAFANIQNYSAMVASFALVVAAIFRIAPALNRIQTSVINIGIGRGYLKFLLEFYEKFDMENFNPVMNKIVEPLQFKHKIELKNICFSYVEDKPVLKNISFEINKGDFIGIIGLSGSGKTTLADVFMGLLPQESGEILVDGVKLTEQNYHNFKCLIGYVPQEVRILEASFRENIAWGRNTDEIDDTKVWHALEGARLTDFVHQFEHGIYAKPFIGTNGVSQGQKQRIALARVLYRNPEILVLDEATSSLDVKVEHEITEMLNNLKNKKTIIAIAHRLSTLKTCTKLIYIKDGRVVDIGSFRDLSEKYEDFNNLIKLSSIN